MNNRYLLSLVSTTLLYGVSIGGFFYYQDSFLTKQSNQKNIENQSVSLAFYEAPKPHLVKPEPKPELKKLEPKPKPKKIEKKLEPKPKKIVKKIKPKKVEAKKIVKKEPIKKIKPKKIKQAKEIEKKLVKKEPKKHTPKQIVQKSAKQKIVSKTKNAKQNVDAKLQQKKQKQYLAYIKKVIEKNKFYPKSAKRRGIESDIKVSFTVTKAGNVEKITILSGKKIFYKSVKNTISKSFPIEPNGALVENIDVSLVLKYKLL